MTEYMERPAARRPSTRERALALLVEAREGRLHLREIARRVGASAGTTARELGRLEEAGLVSSEREGRQRYFAAVAPLAPPPGHRTGETRAAHGPGVDPALGSILRRIVEAYQPEAVYLFGSRARGTADDESDVDLLVVVPADASPERRRPQLAVHALRGVGVPVDTVVMTRPAFELRAHVVNSLPETALREGRLLYGA